MRWLILSVMLLMSRAAGAEGFRLEHLAFMSGCWATAPGAAEDYRECYTAPYAGLMQGASQTVKNGRTLSWEFAVVREEEGMITYAPFANGKPLSVFRLTQLSDGYAVFENPPNDFPKKLIYRKTSEGSLIARIEGSSPADARNQEWAMRPQGP